MLGRLGSWWKFSKAVAAAKQAVTAPGTRDVVVVPCWRRAEFLWHCLDNISRADGIEEALVLFRVDTGYSRDTFEVIQSFAPRLPSWRIEIADPCPFRRTKPSANFLLGLLHGAAISRRLVYLVEEDIMVARDFFRWHRAVHSAVGDLFCSLPVKNPNRKLELPDQADGYYLSSGDSCSNGACYDKDVIRQLIAPHVNLRYFWRPKPYMRQHFPTSKVGLGFVEQDGLIRRIQEVSGRPIAWPCIARAFHSGYYGARGGWQNFGGSGGSLDARINMVSATIYSEQAVRAAMEHDPFVETCIPTSLEPPPWSSLHRVAVPPP